MERDRGGAGMSEKIKTGIAVFLIIMILPYIITYALQGKQLFDVRTEPDQNLTQQEELSQEPTEVLTGILAGQISMDLPMDAIRAQAVLVRTEYVRRERSGEQQEQARSLDELTALWGSQNVRKYYEIAKSAVTDTTGEILTYNGTPIQAAYHKVSAGSTRAVDELNGDATPYLRSVMCGMDITSEDYLTVRFFSFDEMMRALDLSQTDDLRSMTQTSDDAGYVSSVQIGDQEFSGDAFRRLLDLPSPCFYLKEVEGQIRVVVKGKGHGIGMSQYAAGKQAEEGASYQDILNYFFPDTVLEQV